MQNVYLTNILKDLHEIKNDSIKVFGKLNYSQLNWKPSDDKWSIGQCFDHLIVSNELYFPELDEIINGREQKNFWKKIPILPRLFGKLLIGTVDPMKKRKFKAPKVLRPSTSNIGPDIINKFVKHQEFLIEKIMNMDKLDLKKVLVTSVVAKFITYSLHDTLTILDLHERRHFNQAERVLKTESFPKN